MEVDQEGFLSYTTSCLSRVPISDSKGLSPAPCSPSSSFPRRCLSTSPWIRLCQIGDASGCQLVCCRVVRSPVPPSINSFTRSPSTSPPNTALVSTRSIVARARVHICLACSKECPSNLEIRGRGSAKDCRTSARGSVPASRSATQASSRGPGKAFLSNIKKEISVFRVDRPALRS